MKIHLTLRSAHIVLNNSDIIYCNNVLIYKTMCTITVVTITYLYSFKIPSFFEYICLFECDVVHSLYIAKFSVFN